MMCHWNEFWASHKLKCHQAGCGGFHPLKRSRETMISISYPFCKILAEQNTLPYVDGHPMLPGCAVNVSQDSGKYLSPDSVSPVFSSTFPNAAQLLLLRSCTALMSFLTESQYVAKVDIELVIYPASAF